MITQERLRELFEYRDGHLFWKVKKAQRISIGDRAGTADSDGYYRTRIDGRRYKNHRLIYLFFTGNLPKILDHINGIRTDNRIENLRKCTFSQNNMNVKRRKNNRSGYKGVFFKKEKKRYVAQIRINKTAIHLGCFDTAEEAALVYDKKAKELFGEFAVLNFKESPNE